MEYIMSAVKTMCALAIMSAVVDMLLAGGKLKNSAGFVCSLAVTAVTANMCRELIGMLQALIP